MKRVSVLFSVTALAVILIAAAGLALLWSFNHFRVVERDFAGNCAPVSGVPGPEDIQIDPHARQAFISSYDRRRGEEGGARGGVHVFSLDDILDAGAWTDRTRGSPAAFEPLGLYLYRQGQERRLFVVNAATNAIELFQIDANGDLNHLETFTERRLTSPNDIVAVGPRAFYVTNDVEPGRDSLLGRLHFLFRVGSGRVLYFDGVAWSSPAEGLRFANGVNVSADGARLYVAETAAGAVRIFDRRADTGGLRPIATVQTGAAVDNINVDRAGALWIGAHPKPLLLPRHTENATVRSPSQVLRIEDIAGVVGDPETVYLDDGGEISGSTTAARFGETLLIGALLEKKFLICTLPD